MMWGGGWNKNVQDGKLVVLGSRENEVHYMIEPIRIYLLLFYALKLLDSINVSLSPQKGIQKCLCFYKKV